MSADFAELDRIIAEAEAKYGQNGKPKPKPPAPDNDLLTKLRPVAEEAFRAILGQPLIRKVGSKEPVALCPFHDDHHPSLSINLEKLTWYCHTQCKRGGGIVELGKRVWGLEFRDVARRLEEVLNLGRRTNGTKPSQSFEVRNLDGDWVATHLRYDQPDGSKSMPWMPKGVKPTDLPLYQIEKTADSSDGDPVIICEGEKAAQKLWDKHQTLAVGTVTGAGQIPCDESLKPLDRFRVYLWADNDAEGRKHMDRLGNRLLKLGHTEVWTINWAEAPEKGDAADFDGDVAALVEQAQRFALPASSNGHVPDTVPARALVISENAEEAEVANAEYLNRPEMVSGLAFGRAISLTVGGKHEGKTTVTRTAALSVSSGEPIFGRATTQTHVIYAASSDEYATTRMEVLRMGWRKRGLPFTLIRIGDDAAEPQAILGGIAEMAVKLGSRFVVLDMLFDFIRVQDENRYAQTRSAIGFIQTLADDIDGHVWATHHTAKWFPDAASASKAALGSQGIAARVTPIILCRKWFDDLYTIESTMTRDPRGVAIKPTLVTRDENGWVHDGGEFKQWMKWKVYVDRILGLFEGQDGQSMSANAVAEALDISKHEARNALLQMFKNGMLDRRNGRGNAKLYSMHASGLFEEPQAQAD